MRHIFSLLIMTTLCSIGFAAPKVAHATGAAPISNATSQPLAKNSGNGGNGGNAGVMFGTGGAGGDGTTSYTDNSNAGRGGLFTGSGGAGGSGSTGDTNGK